jgi:hypothetical protein
MEDMNRSVIRCDRCCISQSASPEGRIYAAVVINMEIGSNKTNSNYDSQ